MTSFKVRQPIRPRSTGPNFLRHWCAIVGHRFNSDIFMDCRSMVRKGFYLMECQRCGFQKKESIE